MTAPDDIKAGDYELLSVFWEQPTSQPGEPYTYKRHVQGDIIRLDVEEARRLVLSGAAVKKGEREKQAALAAKVQYENSLSLLPPEVRAQLDEQSPDGRVAELERQLAEQQAKTAAAEAAVKPPSKS